MYYNGFWNAQSFHKDGDAYRRFRANDGGCIPRRESKFIQVGIIGDRRCDILTVSRALMTQYLWTRFYDGLFQCIYCSKCNHFVSKCFNDFKVWCGSSNQKHILVSCVWTRAQLLLSNRLWPGLHSTILVMQKCGSSQSVSIKNVDKFIGNRVKLLPYITVHFYWLWFLDSFLRWFALEMV